MRFLADGGISPETVAFLTRQGHDVEAQYRTMRDAGALDDDVVSGAADAILFERARVLLLGGAEDPPR